MVKLMFWKQQFFIRFWLSLGTFRVQGVVRQFAFVSSCGAVLECHLFGEKLVKSLGVLASAFLVLLHELEDID
jgi:hypothetical protein